MLLERTRPLTFSGRNRSGQAAASLSGERRSKRSLWFALDTNTYHSFFQTAHTHSELHLLETVSFFSVYATADTFSGRFSTSEGPLRCPSINAYVRPRNGDSIGQLIEQYPESDKRTEEKLCSMVPSSGWSGTRRSHRTVRALPCCCCWGSLDNNYLLYLH